MPTNDSTYGGTIPPRTDVGPTPLPTTTTVPAKPAPSTGLAFTGYDLVGTLVIIAVLVVLGAVALAGSVRLKPHPADDLVVPGAGGDLR